MPYAPSTELPKWAGDRGTEITKALNRVQAHREADGDLLGDGPPAHEQPDRDRGENGQAFEGHPEQHAGAVDPVGRESGQPRIEVVPQHGQGEADAHQQGVQGGIGLPPGQGGSLRAVQDLHRVQLVFGIVHGRRQHTLSGL